MFIRDFGRKVSAFCAHTLYKNCIIFYNFLQKYVCKSTKVRFVNKIKVR